MIDISSHDSVKLAITTEKANSSVWTEIVAFNDSGDEVMRVTFFGKQQLVLGGNDE